MELDQHEDEVVSCTDWWASIRLAAAFSVVAAVSALLLFGRMPETTIILSIIVVGTMVGWLHEEHPLRTATLPSGRRR